MATPIPTIKRLLHDLKEVLENPLPNVVAVPLEDDLLVWHGNVRGDPAQPDHPFANVPFHFVLVFPNEYPNKAPEVQLFTALPHPNVSRSLYPLRGAPFRLALFDCVPAHDAWSCAFTVHSILVQLQQFLLDPDLLWDSSKTTPQQAAAHALQVTVQACGHSGSEPYPPFLTPEALQAAQLRRSKVSVAKPNRRAKKSASLPSTTPPARLAAPQEDKAPATPITSKESAKHAAKEQEEEWVEVKGKRRNGAKTGPASGAASSSQAAARPVAGPNRFNLLTAGAAAPQELPLQVANSGTPASSVSLSKSAKKNRKRGQRRAAAVASSSGPPSAETTSTELAGSVPQSAAADTWQVVKGKKPAANVQGRPAALEEKTARELIQEVKAQVQADSLPAVAGSQDFIRSNDLALPTGSFDLLPPDVLSSILSLLPGKELALLGSACKGLRAACSEGEVWQSMLKRDFPASQLSASRASDWKHAYMLQTSNIVGELQCFFSKVSFEDTVLGMPLRWTVNPRTGALDYIQADPELLSVAAFQQGARKSPDNKEVMAVLPAYLTEEHFKSALPAMPKLLRALLPERPGNQVTAEAWLDALPKILNTAIVLIMDNGVKMSDSALSTYCSVHRLLLALAEHHSLWDAATLRLDRFLRHENMRGKDACPNLGTLIPLIGLSSKHSWKDCVLPLLEELFARSILWLCKAFPDMADRVSRSPASGGFDEELNAKAFESMKVGRRLVAFHVAFLNLVARPPNTNLDQVIDAQDLLFGRPGPGLQRRMKGAIETIMGMQTWDDFFRLVGVQLYLPTAHMVTKLLRRGWVASLQKGYHKKGMDFSRVQASGVSKLLLKGETYSAPPNMRSIEMEVHYRWAGGGDYDYRYLDGACLLFASDGRFMEAVAWNHRRSFGTQRPGAVKHSGDIMDPANHAGKNTCSIKLDDLGPQVQEMYWTLSAWAGSMLIDLKQPYVSVVDPKTSEPLCEYHLEDKQQDVLRTHKSVVMCRFFRGSRTGSWEVEALGILLRNGDTSTYAPMIEHIHGLIRSRERTIVARA